MKIAKIFIEASPLTEERMSGVGNLTLDMVRALERHPQCGSAFKIILVAGFDKIDMLKRWNLEKVRYKAIPLPQRVFNLIWKFDLLPPMDLILGRGTYVFPNYKNWRVLSSKSLTYIHDLSFILYPQFVAPKNQKFLVKNVATWIKRTDKVLTISKNSQTEIIKYLHVADHKTCVIYPGVDTTYYFRRDDKEVQQIKQQLGIRGKYLLYVGNIEPRKNLSNLIQAYRELPLKLCDEYSLVLVGGGGWLNEQILIEIKQAQEQGLKVIHPTQFVPDKQLPALYTGASLLAHPSLYEGFGLSLVQAMACGTPVLAGNNSSMPEVVGEAALLVDSGDIADISSTIKRVLGHKGLADELSNMGLKRAMSFPWQRTADELVDIITKPQEFESE